MRILALILLSVVLVGCSTTKPQVKPLVIETRPQSNIAMPIVAPLPDARYPVVKFQSPSNPSTIVGMDEENYNKFRELLLTASRRELDWYNRLYQANGTIRLLQE